MIFIPNQEAGGTEANLSPIFPALETCEFKSIFSHMYVELLNKRELTKEEIERADAESGGNLNAPIQMNSIYILCPVENKSTIQDDRFPLRKLGQKGTAREVFVIRVKTSSPEERQTKEFPYQCHHDIEFYDDATDKFLGFYNRDLNLLWIPDVTHNKDQVLKRLSNYLDPVMEFRRTGKIINKVKLTIGADPEFEILRPDGTVFNASTIFKDKDLGHDGHAETGEIRPEPAMYPLKLVRNIKKILRKLNANPLLPYGSKVCAGGGVQLNIGGHLHFGIKNMPEPLKNAMFDLMAEPMQRVQGRLRNGFDGFKKGGHDVVRRAEAHDGVEWRPLPSFIVNEEITSAVVVTAYAMVKSYLLKKFDQPYTVETFRKLSLYPVYRKYIEKFIELFWVTRNTQELSGRDIIKEWRLNKTKTRVNVIIQSASPWIKKALVPLSFESPVNVTARVDFGPYEQLVLVSEYNDEAINESLSELGDEFFIEYTRLNKGDADRRDRDYTFSLLLPRAWAKTRRQEQILSLLRKNVKMLVLFHINKMVEKEVAL